MACFRLLHDNDDDDDDEIQMYSHGECELFQTDITNLLPRLLIFLPASRVVVFF